MGIIRSSRDTMSTEGAPSTQAGCAGDALFSRKALVRAVLLSTLCLSPSQSVQPKPAAAARSFFEPFDGLDGRRWYISDGWVNGAHQGCTWSRAAVDVRKGMLQMSVLRYSNKLRPLVCGELQALGGAYGYGTYEARMRVAAGSGLNTAMFTYSGPPITPVHDEIDFEFLGKARQKVQLNYFVGARGMHGTDTPLAADASADFHDYAFVWEPGKVRWFVDGKLVRTADSQPLPTTAGRFYLSLWSGSSTVNDWLGPMDAGSLPAKADVDWVAYTATGERCLFPTSITCQAL